ncbi:MAG: AAA family ATPase [Acidaminococcaceae bacterium]
MKILNIEFTGIPIFKDEKVKVNFFASDRVIGEDRPYPLANSIYTQKNIALVGINATGKTSTLRLIRLALNVVVKNTSLNDAQVIANGIIKDNTMMQVVFFHRDRYIQLQSTLGWREDVEDPGKKSLFYKEEIIRIKPKYTVKAKKDILDFDGANVVTEKRSEMDIAIKKILRDDDSFVIQYTRKNGCSVRDAIEESNFNLLQTIGSTPAAVLQVFDNNIEYLMGEAEEGTNNIKWQLKFKNQSTAFDTNNLFEVSRLLSSGTVKGQNIIGNVVVILKTGGYLIIDELENHFNKELVRMIINLFKEEKTNPYGACLIFSTHYMEVLDFIDRKDNIYITKKQGGLIEVLNYADVVKRNDVKKSEVILSNSLQGTAPQYESIKKLRELICNQF